MLNYKIEEIEKLDEKLIKYFEYLKQEDNDICRVDLLKTIVNIYAEREKIAVEAIANISKNRQDSLEDWIKMQERYNVLEEKFKQQQEESEQALTGLPLLLIDNPVGTMRLLFKDADRTMKVADQSGDAWTWMLHFGWKARLKMAWKLLFPRGDAA